MRSLKLVINCLLFILIKECLDSITLALIIFIVNSLLIIRKNPYIDKDFISFIKKANNYKNIDDALKERKYQFSKENNKLIEDYKKIVTTENEYKRFIKIQEDKVNMLIKEFNSRLLSYALNSFIALLPLAILFYYRHTNVYYYYSLYNGGYICLLILVLVITLLNSLNMYKETVALNIDTKSIDEYSLCFHKNVLALLNISDSKLDFNEKGYVKKINTKPKYKINFIYYNLISIIVGLISVVGFIK